MCYVDIRSPGAVHGSFLRSPAFSFCCSYRMPFTCGLRACISRCITPAIRLRSSFFVRSAAVTLCVLFAVYRSLRFVRVLRVLILVPSPLRLRSAFSCVALFVRCSGLLRCSLRLFLLGVQRSFDCSFVHSVYLVPRFGFLVSFGFVWR